MRDNILALHYDELSPTQKQRYEHRKHEIDRDKGGRGYVNLQLWCSLVQLIVASKSRTHEIAVFLEWHSKVDVFTGKWNLMPSAKQKVL
jgi:hypothetical protein